jgi:hypothetical protein
MDIQCMTILQTPDGDIGHQKDTHQKGKVSQGFKLKNQTFALQDFGYDFRLTKKYVKPKYQSCSQDNKKWNRPNVRS